MSPAIKPAQNSGFQTPKAQHSHEVRRAAQGKPAE